MTSQDLLAAARAVRARAYAPYSDYPVGAALRTAEGDVFSGCNVENASFGLTVCAERNAVFAAVAAGQRRVVELVIVTPSAAGPCGACRQVLAEFAGPDLPIHLAGPEGGELRTVTLGELLPGSFGPGDLAAWKARGADGG